MNDNNIFEESSTSSENDSSSGPTKTTGLSDKGPKESKQQQIQNQKLQQMQKNRKADQFLWPQNLNLGIL